LLISIPCLKHGMFKKESVMRLLMLLFYLILIIIGVSFAALNATAVKINLYIIQFSIPISVLIIIVFGVGIIIGFLLFLCRYLRLKHEYKKVKKQLELTEKEIKNLRSIPLKDQH